MKNERGAKRILYKILTVFSLDLVDDLMGLVCCKRTLLKNGVNADFKICSYEQVSVERENFDPDIILSFMALPTQIFEPIPIFMGIPFLFGEETELAKEIISYLKQVKCV